MEAQRKIGLYINDGIVYLRSECSKERILDLSGGNTADGNNMQIWSINNTDAQKFWIDICSEVINVGEDFSGFIVNSHYWKPIMQDSKNNVVLGTENSQIWHGSYGILLGIRRMDIIRLNRITMEKLRNSVKQQNNFLDIPSNVTDEIVKHKIKDSVFTDLFKDKKYLFQLYKALHPEEWC